jgi:hypothetical protein
MRHYRKDHLRPLRCHRGDCFWTVSMDVDFGRATYCKRYKVLPLRPIPPVKAISGIYTKQNFSSDMNSVGQHNYFFVGRQKFWAEKIVFRVNTTYGSSIDPSRNSSLTYWSTYVCTYILLKAPLWNTASHRISRYGIFVACIQIWVPSRPRAFFPFWLRA